MTTTTTPTYRRTKAGEWVAFGPAEIVQVGALTIAKRDGSTKTETVERLGKSFTVDGVACRYGYLAPTSPRSHSHSVERVYGRPVCNECGEIIQHPGQYCWEMGGTCHA